MDALYYWFLEWWLPIGVLLIGIAIALGFATAFSFAWPITWRPPQWRRTLFLLLCHIICIGALMFVQVIILDRCDPKYDDRWDALITVYWPLKVAIMTPLVSLAVLGLHLVKERYFWLLFCVALNFDVITVQVLIEIEYEELYWFFHWMPLQVMILIQLMLGMVFIACAGLTRLKREVSTSDSATA
jgi:hypothetical protein